MRRHPFHGIVTSEAASTHAHEHTLSPVERHGRRAFFGRVLAGLFGMGSLLVFGRSAAAQHQGGIGFDSGFSRKSGGSFRGGLGGTALDRNLTQNRPPVTTFALGEQGGGRVTTRALGEEGGRVTTYAVGEEGSYYYYPPRRRRYYTTYALGEEGGWNW